MSLLLSRPPIINPSYSSFDLPNLQLESVDPENGPPSPVTHIAAQCQLGGVMAGVPASMGGTSDTSKADSIKSDIEDWIASLHPAYVEVNPDTRWDDGHLYVPLQRRQLHAIGYMTMLLPFKPFLAKTFDSNSSETERSYRKTAVDIAIHLMEVSRRLFDQVYPINAKFHLVTFLIFDTAAFFCSALIHDKDRSLPRRGDIIQSIRLACGLLGKLAPLTKTGAICYPVLARLAKSLSKSTEQEDSLIGENGVTLSIDPGIAPDFDPLSLSDTISPDSFPSSLDSMVPGTFLPASLDFTAPDMEIPPVMSVGDFSNIDAGQFDQIWDWQNLDLTLLPSLPG